MADTMFVNSTCPTGLKASLKQDSTVSTLDSLPSIGSSSDEYEVTEDQRKRIKEVSRNFAELEMRLNSLCLRSMEMAAQVQADSEMNQRLEAQNANLHELFGQLIAGQKPTLTQEQQSLIFGPRAQPAAPEPLELPLPRFATPSGHAEQVLEKVLREYDSRVACMAAQKEDSFPKFRL